MNNIYFVYLVDNYSDEYSNHLVAIYIEQDQAIEYAKMRNLNHEETIYVEERREGLQNNYNPTIYERKHYDHTEALFSTVCWYDYGFDLSEEQVIAEAVKQVSPLITEDVDLNKLYTLYMETWVYED